MSGLLDCWNLEEINNILSPNLLHEAHKRLTRVELILLGLTGESVEGTGSGVSDRDGIG